MVTLVTRAGKGSPLTIEELDSNFNNLAQAIYEYDPPTANPSNIPELFTRTNTEITVRTAVTQEFTSGIYHYNVNLNSLGEVVSISPWGPGASGLVDGY